MKYVDADRLQAEIRKLRGEKPFLDDSSLLAYLHGLSKIEDLVDSLQQEQPEVDLEKEIDRYCKPIQARQVQEAPFTNLENCARHFYKLGLKARKK